MVDLATGLDPDFDRDERLFHYTSSHGLYGILESGCLWATHYRFLNDSREFYAARESLQILLEGRVLARMAELKAAGAIKVDDGVLLEDISKQEAQNFIDIYYSAMFGSEALGVTGNDAFVFSAFRSMPSDEQAYLDGELLHWATYGRGGGYAIQLNPHTVAVRLAEQAQQYKNLPYVFAPTCYVDRSRIPERLKAEYEKFSAAAVRMIELRAAGAEFGEKEMSLATVPFVNIVSQAKDCYFKSEREARITIIRNRSDQEGFVRHPLHIRHSLGLAVPYIKLFEGMLLGDGTPLERILVSPHPENERRVFALRTYLRERGLASVDVTESKIPYVSVSGE